MCRMPCLLLVLVILISYQILVTGSPITTDAPMTTNEPETGPEIKCGVRSSIKIEREPELSPKIKGGHPVYIQDWPWIVSFRDESNKHFCGGTIISENFILTAAHCFIPTELRHRKISSLHVSVGSDWLNTTIKHPIDKVIIHDKYNPYYNDIALVKLKEPLNFSDTVRPICLPGLSSSFGHNVSFLNATTATAGWGRTEMAYESAYLKGLNLTVKLNSYCNETFSSLKNEIPQEITENQLCAEGHGGDSCNGDSGGPLITNGPQDPETNQTIIYQIGIVSYGAECYVSGYPGVYTRITNYIPWINEQLTK